MDLIGRDVIAQKWVNDKSSTVLGKWVNIEGKLVAFGIQSEYSDMASLVYSSAIILGDDGQFHNVPVENVKLIS